MKGKKIGRALALSQRTDICFSSDTKPVGFTAIFRCAIYLGVISSSIARLFRRARTGSQPASMDDEEKPMLNEFKAFIARGNVIDLAVGIIIGGAFTLIVNSLVNDIIMPVIGAITGGLDFSNFFFPLSNTVTATSLAAAREQGAVFAYGNFLTVVLNFVILAWIIFLLVKGVNKMRASLEKQKNEEPAAPPPVDVQLLTEIRDLLKQRA
jgi:large conductance mechanosensitive channel